MTLAKLRLTTVCALLAATTPLAPALASGGGMGGGGMGGGGGMPSVTAPQYNAAEEYQHGADAYKGGKFKDAARYFEHVTEAQPKVATGWFMLGMARTNAGDAKGASRAFATSIKMDPSPIDAHREYALALAKLKQTDKASAELATLKGRAGACNDTCPEAADLKAAIGAVEQALSGAAPTARLETPSALGFAASGEGDAAYVRAVSLINERRFEEALTALRQAETVFGPHPDILTYEGYTWRKLGQLDRAEGYYKAALAIAPGHRGATEYYGELKVIRGDLPGARAMLATLDAQCAFGCIEAEDLRRWIERGGDPAS